jgi:DNA-directed RNA polymerase subunit E'/Rpb7
MLIDYRRFIRRDARAGCPVLDRPAAEPWLVWVDRLGDVLTGRVTKVVPFGIFVGVDDGLSGLVHNSQLPCPGDYFRIGDEVTVQIAKVEPGRRRINLALPDSIKAGRVMSRVILSGRRPFSYEAHRWSS